jgi:2-methylcitrate dehydratase PrpD
MMKRVEMHEDPELDPKFHKKWCGTVEITTTDGRTFFKKVEYPKGKPENPLSWDEMMNGSMVWPSAA